MTELTEVPAVAGHTSIGVVGASPLTVDGLRQALVDAGVGEVVALDRSSSGAPVRILIVYVGAHRHLDHMREVRRRRPELPLVAVVPDELWGRVALEAGATSALRTCMTSCEFVQVIRSCVQGHPLIPTELAVAILRTESVCVPSWEDLVMIDGLARGERVRALAGRLGYSERHLHRMLKELYRKLLVHDRAAAIAAARERGWLSDMPDS